MLVLGLAVALATVMMPGAAVAKDAGKSDCKSGGWQGLVRSEDGSPFADQGSCVSYVAEGGTPVPPDPLRAACDAVGGTFRDTSPTEVVYNYECSALLHLSWEDRSTFQASYADICFGPLYPGPHAVIAESRLQLGRLPRVPPIGAGNLCRKRPGVARCRASCCPRPR